MAAEKIQTVLKRTITLGELVSACVVVVVATLSFWINTNVRLSALEINQKALQQTQIDAKDAFKEVGDKLDKLNDGQNEIKVTLQNKQDRK